jgi:hypothetical protein
MISGKVAALIAVVMLVAFSGITYETISHGSSSTTTAITPSSQGLVVTSPQNDTTILIPSAGQTINLTINITSSSSPVYLFDVSPSNLSSIQKQSRSPVEVYSIYNLTYLNRTSYPYNYMIENVPANSTVSLNMTLYINQTGFQEMKTSNLKAGPAYPYIVEILVETSSGAAGIGITLLKI